VDIITLLGRNLRSFSGYIVARGSLAATTYEQQRENEENGDEIMETHGMYGRKMETMLH